MKILSVILIFILFLAGCTRNKTNSQNPNVIIILADDMGYGDVQALNQDSKIPTPNLNRLAKEGVVFTDAHTPSAVCTPTRYGLLTGRYCWRSRLKNGVLNGYGAPLIEENRSTLALLLKGIGYSTGIVGKWHLGLGFQKDSAGNFDFAINPGYTPNNAGFDYSYIIPASLDFPPYVYIENDRITEFPSIPEKASPFPAFWRQGERSPNFVMENTLDDLLQKANNFIEKQSQAKNPFFLYFPLTAPHKPVLPHTRFKGKTELGPYGDFVNQVDWTVGEVLKKLDQLNLAENTLVIYTSDNGSFMYRLPENEPDHVSDESIQAFNENNHTSNFVFRGTKADIWEAGHHVPFFVRWPKNLDGKKVVNKTICLTDIYATLADVLQIKTTDSAAPDSYSFSSLLFNAEEDKYSRPSVIHHSVNGMFAIRNNEWKLVLGNGSGGREKPQGKPFEKPYQLFNMKTDLGEINNLIDEFPELAKKMEEECLKIIGNDL